MQKINISSRKQIDNIERIKRRGWFGDAVSRNTHVELAGDHQDLPRNQQILGMAAVLGTL